jgi:hypothetical protein
MEFRTALTDDDVACADWLATINLDAKAFGNGISA